MEEECMIAKLKGTLDSIGTNFLILDVNGVGYLLYCSSKTLSHLICGEFYTFFTETIVREDLFNLYGFLTEEERNWFRLLTTVQGVGMKVGLAILSIAAPHQLEEAIAHQDQGLFTQADGVGPKLAARLVNELKDKVIPNEAKIIPFTPQTQPSMYQDAVSVLLNLGYKPFEANQAVGFAKQQAHTTLEDVIRSSLTRLSQAKG
jgi:Holliday junction DNA helicase RuvA